MPRMAPLFLASVLLATPIVYTFHESKQTREVTDWSKEPRVWVATHRAKLHEHPSADSVVTYELKFGWPVKVVHVMTPEPVVVDGRADRWYRIASEGRAGYVFGDALTSARFEDDFDQDGEAELATVAFTSDFMIRVRFFEPKEQIESFVDVRPSGGAFLGLEGGNAYAEALKKGTAGLPLIHVDTHVEACADFSDAWISYANGTPRLALHQSGLIDPPNHATYKVEFQAAKKRALIKREKAEEEDKPHRKWTEVWSLDGGVFVPPVN